MLVIRLSRKGKKNQPFFKLIVTDKRTSPKGGRAVEILGFVDPLAKRKNINKERTQYWLSKGAKPSDTVHNLLVEEKIIDAAKINVSKVNKAKLAKKEAEKPTTEGAAEKTPEASLKTPEKTDEPIKKEEPVKEETPETEKPAEKKEAVKEEKPAEVPVEAPVVVKEDKKEDKKEEPKPA